MHCGKIGHKPGSEPIQRPLVMGWNYSVWPNAFVEQEESETLLIFFDWSCILVDQMSALHVLGLLWYKSGLMQCPGSFFCQHPYRGFCPAHLTYCS